MSKIWCGISFPFRVGIKGGIVLSKATMEDVAHIEESLAQILTTNVESRIMEEYFGSTLSLSIFEPNEEATYTLLKHEILEAIKLYEPRVLVKESDIQLTSEANFIYVDLNFSVVEFGGELYSTRIGIKTGGGNIV